MLGGGGGGSVANAGFMIHDSFGNYIHVILHHSVLVRSVRCQIGCHGEKWAYVTAADVTCSEEAF